MSRLGVRSRRDRTVRSFVDEVIGFRDRFWLSGWALAPRGRVRVAVEHGGGRLACEVVTGLPSADVAAVVGYRGARCRFQVSGALPAGAHADELVLVLRYGRQTERREQIYLDRVNNDPYHALERRFFDAAGDDVLELGSRARSGHQRRDRLGTRRYTGVDVVDGPNVDVVGDAHDLRSRFEPCSFDAVFAISVFEHLAMPWRVALEVNSVLRPGGLVFVASHQTFPLHEVPWDFFRFSDSSWHALFNRATGFEVLATAHGEAASVVPLSQHPITRDVALSAAYLGSAVLARKVGEAAVSWDVDLAEVVRTSYPH